MTYTILIRKEVQDEDINDIMDAALAGGIGYWVDDLVLEKRKDYDPAKDKKQYTSEALTNGYNMVIYVDGERYVLSVEKLVKGMEMHEKLDIEDYDAGDADCAVQYALFNELVYS